MEPADLDHRLNRALERLPAPVAPGTLLQKVMQAVDSRAHTPWYRRAWRLWPLGWQVVSLAGCIGLAALVVDQGPWPAFAQVVTRDTLAPAQAVTSQVEPTVAALQILWRVVIAPLVPVVFAMAMLMCVACVAIGLTLNYVVLGRTWQR
jgi:hypothetical protein